MAIQYDFNSTEEAAARFNDLANQIATLRTRSSNPNANYEAFLLEQQQSGIGDWIDRQSADYVPEPTIEPKPYSVYDDPTYQQALAGAQSQFNLARINALAEKQYGQRPITRELENRPQVAEAARQRLAGNFAARGMSGGRAGVLTRAEAELNAREIAQRTGLREQISELDRQFTAQFGAEGSDWLGTRFGMEAQQAAIQQALQNRLAGLTTVG